MSFKHILLYYFLFVFTGCYVIDKIKNKTFNNEKQKLFIVASKKEVDINKFEIKKQIDNNTYLTDIGYILYSGVGKIKTTYSLTKFLTLS